jgi:hypothetical protein
VAHPIVSMILSRKSFLGLQQIGGITKVEMKVNLTNGCVTPLYIVNLAYDGRSHLFISFLSDKMRLCIDDCSLRFRIWPAYT